MGRSYKVTSRLGYTVRSRTHLRERKPELETAASPVPSLVENYKNAEERQPTPTQPALRQSARQRLPGYKHTLVSTAN